MLTLVQVCCSLLPCTGCLLNRHCNRLSTDNFVLIFCCYVAKQNFVFCKSKLVAISHEILVAGHLSFCSPTGETFSKKCLSLSRKRCSLQVTATVYQEFFLQASEMRHHEEITWHQRRGILSYSMSIEIQKATMAGIRSVNNILFTWPRMSV